MLGDDAIMIAYGAGKALDKAEDVIAAWQDAARKLKGEVESRNDSIRRLMAEKANMDQQWTSDVRTLEKQLAETQRALDDKTMHIAGLVAQRDAYMEQHPDSPLLHDSGERFRSSGNIKTKARLIYEAAHDAMGRELGIVNPAERRND